MAGLKGKVVLVTGAGKGNGRALAQAFASHGASLAINDLTPINLDETEAGIRAAGGRVKAYIVDVTKKMPIQGLVNAVLDDWGRIDILINCARVKPASTLLDMDDWDWQRTLDVNLTGVFLLMQSVGRVMRDQGGGTMINIAANLRNEHKQAAYAISKAGLVELCARAKLEFGRYGIDVHLIHPEEGNDLIQQALSLSN
jgi:NAD(P)-dependent dehydrogenase (short-subunit alcohol dehydrogenase family)